MREENWLIVAPRGALSHATVVDGIPLGLDRPQPRRWLSLQAVRGMLREVIGPGFQRIGKVLLALITDTQLIEEKILETANKLNCDIIVMGTHGTGTFADAMLGSTARRVVRHSKKPVFVVRLTEE